MLTSAVKGAKKPEGKKRMGDSPPLSRLRRRLLRDVSKNVLNALTLGKRFLQMLNCVTQGINL